MTSIEPSPFHAARLALAILAAGCVNAGHCTEIGYVFKPGDNPWNFSRQHLLPGRSASLIELNSITDPHHIAPGTEIRVPTTWLARISRPVRVVETAGGVTQLLGKDGSKPLKAGDTISPNSRIRTAEQSSVTLQFADGSRVLIRENSDVRLERNVFVPLSDERDIRMALPKGNVENEVTHRLPAAGRFEIRTPSGVAAVRGTRFRMAGSARETRTEVLAGKVVVAAAKRPPTSLPAGFGLALGNGRGAVATRLLPAPQFPESKLLVEQVPAELNLPPVNGAVAYRTLVSAGQNLSAPLSEQRTEQPLMRILDIPDGQYTLRVRAIDANGLEGNELQLPLSINARPNPPFVLGPKADAQVAEARPHFRWTRSTEASQYHFQLAGNREFMPLLADEKTLVGNDFTVLQDLPEGKYFWRLASISASEGAGPFGEAQAFLRVPALPGQVGFSDDQHSLSWKKVSSARYRVQVGNSQTIDPPLIDRIVDSNQLALDDIDPGSYFVRVQTLGMSGIDSPWSDVQAFEIPSRFDWRYLLLVVPVLFAL